MLCVYRYGVMFALWFVMCHVSMLLFGFSVFVVVLVLPVLFICGLVCFVLQPLA